MSEQDIIDYYEKGDSLTKLKVRSGLSIRQVYKILRKNEVKLRSLQDQKTIERMRQSQSLVNESYFDNLTDESSYYLGVIAAIGVINDKKNEVKISMTAADTKYLDEFRKNIGLARPLTLKNKGKTVEMTFSSLKIVQRLASYGITSHRKENKSMTILKIPDNFHLAFVKGYLDGNAQIKAGNLIFSCTSPYFLDEINIIFRSRGLIYKERKTKLYKLNFNPTDTVMIIKVLSIIKTPCR